MASNGIIASRRVTRQIAAWKILLPAGLVFRLHNKKSDRIGSPLALIQFRSFKTTTSF